MHRTRDSRSRHKFSEFYRLPACCFLSLSHTVSSKEGYRANGSVSPCSFLSFYYLLCAWFFEERKTMLTLGFQHHLFLHALPTLSQ